MTSKTLALRAGLALLVLPFAACSSKSAPPVPADTAASAAPADTAAPAAPADTTATAAPADTAAPAAPAPAAAAPAGAWTSSSERFGALRLGMTQGEILAAFGRAEQKDTPERWAADGMLHTSWSWPTRGLGVDLAGEERVDDVVGLTITPPSALRTTRGIGLGSTKAEVEAAYAGAIDAEMSREDQTVVGSLYDGLMIQYKDGKVSGMFLGAAAE